MLEPRDQVYPVSTNQQVQVTSQQVMVTSSSAVAADTSAGGPAGSCVSSNLPISGNVISSARTYDFPHESASLAVPMSGT